MMEMDQNKYDIRNHGPKLRYLVYFSEKKFFWQKIDLRGTPDKFLKTGLRGTSGRFLAKKFFFQKDVLGNVVLIPDFEYHIYFSPSPSFLCVSGFCGIIENVEYMEWQHWEQKTALLFTFFSFWWKKMYETNLCLIE